MRSELHEHFPVVPEIIREYIEEVQRHLEAITDYEGADLSPGDKLRFLRETRHAFGRTALVLSGGGALGAFHIVRARPPQAWLAQNVGSIVTRALQSALPSVLHCGFDVVELL